MAGESPGREPDGSFPIRRCAGKAGQSRFAGQAPPPAVLVSARKGQLPPPVPALNHRPAETGHFPGPRHRTGKSLPPEKSPAHSLNSSSPAHLHRPAGSRSGKYITQRPAPVVERQPGLGQLRFNLQNSASPFSTKPPHPDPLPHEVISPLAWGRGARGEGLPLSEPVSLKLTAIASFQSCSCSVAMPCP